MNTSPSEEPDDPPRRRLWLLHPSTISLGLVLVLLATCAISNVRDRVHRSALAQALTMAEEVGFRGRLVKTLGHGLNPVGRAMKAAGRQGKNFTAIRGHADRVLELGRE